MDGGASPEEFEALRVALAAAEARADVAEAELAVARAKTSDDQAQIAHLKLQIAKLQRQRFGPHAERSRRLLDQLELQLEELEASASEDELAAEMAAAKTTGVAAFSRPRPGGTAVPRAPAARARGHPGAVRVPCLRRRPAVQARRGRDRDARGDPAAVEGGADRAGEIFLSDLRDDHAAADAVPRRAARLGRTELPRHAAVREVRPAPTPQPPGRAL